MEAARQLVAGERDVLEITTSGSSGHPKTVVLSRTAVLASAAATAARIGEGAWLLALPDTYIAGIQVIVRSLRAGHEPVALTGPFRAEAFTGAVAAMPDGVPWFTSFVPAQLQTIVDDADAAAALGRFAAILVGGQALSPALAARAAAAGAHIVRTYGSSETSGGCVYDGVPLDGVDVRIVDGEVRLAGPMLADGYAGDPARTAAVFVTDDAGRRWYRTGDAGSFEGGVLRVTGRLDNVIISGGVNVSLDRVEAAVRALSGRESALVVGAPHGRWGQVPVVVVARADAPVDRDAALAGIRSAVGADLGAPARPDRLVVVDEVPLLTSGKPDRAALTRAVAGS